MELASMPPESFHFHHHHRHPQQQKTPMSLSSSPSLLCFVSCSRTVSFQGRVSCCALKTRAAGSSSQEVYGGGPTLRRKPALSPVVDECKDPVEVVDGEGDADVSAAGLSNGGGGERWVDWEDQILEEAVPLAGLARKIIHSGKYENGARLSPEHQKAILEKLLPFHPECEKKIGCGVDYITIGFHPEFEGSRCLFIVRTDGEMVDFSYWKCIKGLIRKKFPLFADSFIVRHFGQRKPLTL
ncbi:hypothetical protein Dimus_027985 [Dionaea muscipula]